ncbi:site-specific DNA-methyltransferase, partial [Candidatus Bathyarchaeota archaeon]|nr:site-specific DNA-methyltransferase [Candidatus Bathyarchaeota archaeon]
MNEAKTGVSQLPINQVLCGDCVEIMKTLSNETVDMAMFSPPYWGLRDYGVEKQIGLEEHPSKYIAKMLEVCGEVKRLLKKTGSMYIVIGDTYYTHLSGGKDYRHNFRTSETAINIGLTMKRPKVSFGENFVSEKQLLLMPARVAIALQEDGWILRNDIIWNKPNHMPSSVKDRLTNAYEHIFHFVKNRSYYYDLDAIREKHKCAEEMEKYRNEPRIAKAKRFRRRESHFQLVPTESPHRGSKDVIGRYEGDTFQTKKKPYVGNNPHRMRLEADQHIALDPNSPMDLSHPLGKNPSDVLKFKGDETQPAGRLAKSRDTYRALGLPEGHLSGKNPADFWNITTKPFKGAHFAVYPEEVCIRPIQSSCPPNGIVLDLMCGSGTTLAVAKKLGRKFIG